MMITAAAGPISNVCMAFGCMVVFACLIAFNVDMGEVTENVHTLIFYGIFINVVLAAFNMLPVPPLDGSRIADGLMPESLRPNWDAFCRSTPIPLIVLIVFINMPGVNLFYFLKVGTLSLVDLMIRLLGG